MTRPLLLSLTLLIACGDDDNNGSDDSPNASVCGDVDGPEGEVPNILGNWTADFGASLFEEGCGIEGLSRGGDTFLDGAMEIGGRVPDTLYVTFNSLTEDDRFFGLEASTGGVAFSGTLDTEDGLMHAAFGGLAYYDDHRDRVYIEGFGYIGVDLNKDGSIDCALRGEWTAAKSGA